MVDNLRLRVVLDMAERVLSPLKKISAGSLQAAQSLKDLRARLKELNAQQNTMDAFGKQKAVLGEMSNKLRVVQQQLASMRQSGSATAAQIKAQESAVTKHTAAYEKQRTTVMQLRSQLTKLGVDKVSAAQVQLKRDIGAANGAMDAQISKMKALGRQAEQLKQLKDKHAKAMLHTGMAVGGGIAARAAGNSMVSPLRSTVNAFMPEEDATAQLRASMMAADGSVPDEFRQINELAKQLGDRLPGTTKDFIEMMTMLRRQGMSAKSVLGGLGEASAYLGVQLRMPVTAAAEFGAKMQDATGTAESDMMGLMDVIQRTYYLGVDPGNMLQGFTKMSPILDVIGKKGLAAARELAPLLVMMDQTGMAGESAGNAIRKVFQAGLSSKKMGKANEALAGYNAGFKLDFTDGKGEFGGTEQMFAQIAKLKALNSVQRTDVIHKLFGDDAEVLQVLNTLMSKGVGGYQEVSDKMKAQADLRKRVGEQLKTLTAALEAAQGSFTNALSEIGATAAPGLISLLNLLGRVSVSIGAMARENPRLTASIFYVAGGLAALLALGGSLVIMLASVIGPMLLTRFVLARLSLGLFGVRTAAAAAAPAMGLMSRVAAAASRAFAFLRPVLLNVGRGIMMLGSFMMANPIVAALALIAAAAYLVWRNWDGIKGGLLIIWQQLSNGVSAWWAATAGGALALWQDLVALKDRFFSAGADLMSGLTNGITSRLAAVREAVVGAADSVGQWFREKLGIASPSRVFMEYGGWISEGAALGMQRGQNLLQAAALAMAATTAMPMAAQADAVSPLHGGAANQAGGMPPLRNTAAAAPSPGGGGGSYQITINAAPGMDPKAIANAVAQELDRRERSQRSRVMSQLSDTE